jgi:chromosome segregation ATPase
MATKNDLQNILKNKHSINKNITQSLSIEECEDLLSLLESQSSVTKLVNSFIGKNEELSQNNRNIGKQRAEAQKKQQRLEKEIIELEKANNLRDNRKEELLKKQQELDQNIQELVTKNEELVSKVQFLTTQNDELIDVNEKLKKDNKDLKNIVDQIRLRLARDTKMLLEYEDSEIRKALIRLFRWTLG